MQQSSYCLCANLRRATRAVTRIYEEEFRRAGFTGSTQYHVLSATYRLGSVRQRDLGATLDIDETTVTRTLRPLFEKGWLAHQEGADRREKWITLTAAGRIQLDLGRPAWHRAQARVQGVLPKGLWESLMAALPQVADLSEAA